MTTSPEIALGATLQIKANTRLVYKGARKATMEMLMEERGPTGGKIIDREPQTRWETVKDVNLTEDQISFWLSKN